MPRSRRWKCRSSWCRIPPTTTPASATWTYSIADSAFDFLAVGETLTLTYVARVDNNFAPNNETDFQTFTITITGTNDKPTVASTGGEITERLGTGNTAIDTVTGTVTFTDADLTDRPVVSAGDFGGRSVPLSTMRRATTSPRR